MHFLRTGLALALLAGLLGALPLISPALAQDAEWDNLPAGEHRELVYALCSGCHSAKLVAQQRLNRKRWDKLLDWMVEEQGMAELDPETEGQVLDYLSTVLGEDQPR